jgi:hypothetical protein
MQLTAETDLIEMEILKEKLNKEFLTIDELQGIGIELQELNVSIANETKRKKLQNLFDLFEKHLKPSFKVQDELLDIYEGILKINNNLKSLEQKGVFSNEEIRNLQEQLIEIESKHLNGGKIFASTNSVDEPKEGQAIIFSSLHKTYRLARKLLLSNEPINSFLIPIHERLSKVVEDLREIEREKKMGKSFEATKFNGIYEELSSIEEMRNSDGNFVPKGSSIIPEGQAEVRYLLEISHDLINKILSREEEEEEFAKLHPIYTAITNFVGEEKIKLEELVMSASKNLKDSFIKGKDRMGEALSTGYAKLWDLYAGNVGEKEENVDPSLTSSLQQLYSVRSALKKLRADSKFFLFSCKVVVRKSEVQESVRRELEGRLLKTREILNSVEEKGTENGRFIGDDGSFAPSGQALLRIVLEECRELLFEIQLLFE